jgi:dolichyl-phosphate beta-glucosyltransferase
MISRSYGHMNKPFLSIVIPARNEEARLPKTLGDVIQFLGNQPFESEVIIVVNASTDRTLEIAQDFARRHSIIQVIPEDLPGKGRAVHKGMLAAIGSYRFFADADFSMPVEEISRFIPPAIDATVAIASREAPGAVRYGEPAYRHVTGRIFNTLIRILVLPHIHDTQCGFKMFRAEAAEDLFAHQTLMGWSFDVELLYVARKRGYKIHEIGIPWHYNNDSKVNVLRDSWKMFFDILRIRRKRWKR